MLRFCHQRLPHVSRFSASATLHRHMSVSSARYPAKKMPITILSGFLGAGKTTFLQNLLSNQKGTRFGLIVNDMASVNVDSKLIKSQTLASSNDGIDTLELQNGCVCCNLADDLLLSVAKLVSLADIRGSYYDHIVVECSGIAEPKGIRQLFQEIDDRANDPTFLAETDGGRAAASWNMVQLDTFITLVDGSVFLNYFGSDKLVSANKQLVSRLPEEQTSLNDISSDRAITDLLLEQVECADHVLINKCDLIPDSQNKSNFLKTLISGINPTATVHTCEFGRIQDPLSIIGSMKGNGVANIGLLEEHKHSVQEADKLRAAVEADIYCQLCPVDRENQHHCPGPKCDDPSHKLYSHHDCPGQARCDHPSHKLETHHDCPGPKCDHPSHKLDSHHNCPGPKCDHPSHKLDSHHNCPGPKCDHPSHTHDNHHDCLGQAKCNHPTHKHESQHDCADHGHHGHHDCSHDHNSHHHDVTIAPTTAQTRFGISSFVYRRRRPFHPRRLTQFLGDNLGKLSVSDLSIVTDATESNPNSNNNQTKKKNPCESIIRSKGFLWLACSHRGAYYLSQAGKHVDMCVLGRWWADIPFNEWPSQNELRKEILSDYYESDLIKSSDNGNTLTIASEEAAGIKIGDRRQEVVFIGQLAGKNNNLQREDVVKDLESVLDQCLLTDEEFTVYESIANASNLKGTEKDNTLRDTFK